MVSLIEGGLANGSLQKRELQIGDHLLGCNPKYKQRRVSAVRDFPARCGPNVLVVHANGDGNGVVAVENGSAGQELMPSCEQIVSVEIDSRSPNGGLDPIEEADSSLDSVVGTTVSFAAHELQDFTEEMKVDVQPIGVGKEAADVVNDTNVMETFKESVEVTESLAMDDVIDEKAKPMLEVVSSVNGTGEEIIPILDNGSSVQGAGEEIKAILEDGYLVDRVDSVNILNKLSPTELRVNDSLNLDNGNPLGLKDKLRRRRVSAIRDFPPLCGPAGQTSIHLGRNGLVASSISNLEITSTETEIHSTVLSESDLHGCHIEKSETKDDSEGADKSMCVDNTISDGNQEFAWKETVLHFQFRNQESKSPETAQDTVVENVREVVHGMMAETYCPEKQVKSAGKEMVQHSQDRSQDNKFLMTTPSPIVENEREVIHGMMAAQYCPWKEDKSAGKEMVQYSQDRSQDNKSLVTVPSPIVENEREIIHGMMAAQYCPWKEDKSALSSSSGVMNDNKVKKEIVGWRGKHVAKKSTLGRDLAKRKSLNAGKIVDDGPGSIIVKGSRKYDANCGKLLDSSPSRRASSLRIDGLSSFPICGNNYDVTLPPLNRKSSSASDARIRVKDTLRTFQSICRKILQEEESKSEGGSGSLAGNGVRRIDLLAANEIKKKKKEVNVGEKIIGPVPGVEVGDEFQYRVELAIIGVHRPYQSGIDYLNRKGKLLALSIVASGAYADDMDNPDVLIYSGQGGNVVGKNKNPEDQKLERGNLALKNSVAEKNYVRVIRGSKENKASGPADARDKIVTTYVYDGLYTVARYYTETGPHGKMVFMFELRRMPGQPELAWKEVKQSKKFKKRQGVTVADISGGKETFPVCAVNLLNDEKPPSFTYITKVMYPDWHRPVIPKGCDCTGRCSSSRKCSCAAKNGGEVPYNYNGNIVEAKTVVFECGPSCKCPPSCYNRVTQRGPSIQLEIFKTESRGWGVRSLSFIPSGTFICEYAGELLTDKEAEQRTSNDEYLFDIGRNGNDPCKTEEEDPIDAEDDGGYTIDAARYGNIGRFINHSCSPNLYAQDVLYDHEDPKMPHIMLFAAENIPALHELTYDYNYCVDQVRDSFGNIKKKNCYCGSTVCTGRMY